MFSLHSVSTIHCAYYYYLSNVSLSFCLSGIPLVVSFALYLLLETMCKITTCVNSALPFLLTTITTLQPLEFVLAVVLCHLQKGWHYQHNLFSLLKTDSSKVWPFFYDRIRHFEVCLVRTLEVGAEAFTLLANFKLGPDLCQSEPDMCAQ